jgi:hypothetical protein
VRRGKPEPLLEDVALCVEMGWTHEELERQPARFVEKLGAYLAAVADREERERMRLEEELGRAGRART